MAEYGDTTSQLKLPQSPFVYLMSGLLAATAVVHLLLSFAPTSHHHPGVDEEPGTP